MNIHIKSIFSAFVFSLLFYSKSYGLNLLLISILAVVLVHSTKREATISWKYSFVYILSALCVFMNPTGFTIFTHFMAFIVFVGKSISKNSSLYISWLAGIINMIVASAANYTKKETERNKKNLSPKLLNRIKGGLVAFVLLLIFGLLYRNANPVFANLIELIDLGFISIPWLFFTLLGYVLFLHLLRPFNPKELLEFDYGQGNELEKPSELILIGSKKKLESEHTLGSMVFLALNVLLIFFLITDTIYLFQENDITNAGYSQSVHQGVYALMLSIVCAIALILYFFRGNLNFFKDNKRIKLLANLWITLNVILVLFTCYKNYAYVEALGLTYKRIGVFVYLILTLTGLITAYIKIAAIKNFVYLVRTNIAALFVFLIVSATIPWNRTITWHNLKNMENPDMGYLIDLGDNNSDQLYRYTKENNQKVSFESTESIQEKYKNFTEQQSKKTWQEYNLYNLVNTNSK